MASPYSLPNVHVSTHPCVKAKLSQLRSHTTNARETKALVHEITLMIGTEALASCLTTVETGTDETPLGYTYQTIATTPTVTLVPILRSGLGMLDALQLLLPEAVSTHHLGLFRESTTLSPVEYYNNLPYHTTSSPTSPKPPTIAILLDPIIATGGTCNAAIQTLLEWGVSRVVVISVLASATGIRSAGTQNGGERVEIWVGGVDGGPEGEGEGKGGLDERGMIMPGLGDVGDRLFGTVGK